MSNRLYFAPNQLFWLVVFVVSLVLILTLPFAVMAQDETPPPEVTELPPTATPALEPVIPPDVMSPEDAGTVSLTAVLSIVAAFANGVLTATIVSVLKLFLPTDATILKNVVGTALTVLYWLAVRYNFGDTFESAGQFAVTVIPALLTLYGGLQGSKAIHQQAVKSNFPLLSYKRSYG